MNRFGIGLIGFVGLWVGCSRSPLSSPPPKYTESRYLMGTVVSLEVCTNDKTNPPFQSVVQQVWERLEEINWRMNVFDDKSDVAKVNGSYEKPVKIGADTYQVIKNSIHFNELTYGAFDITVGPLIKLWKDGQAKNILPTHEEVSEVKKALGKDKIRLLADDHVELLHDQTKIDLGGIAGGYAVDEAVRIFKAAGFHDFMIDEGGDLFVSGKNCEGKPWHIGIRHPRDPSNILEILELRDQAVTTSGDYEQFFEIQNQRWSHIMNPVTGYPQKGVVSATVLAPTTEEADALATALCVLDPKRGVALIDRLGEGFACLLLEESSAGQLVRHESAGYKLLREKEWDK